MKWTALGTGISLVTAIVLGGISASEGQKRAAVVEQKAGKETVRSKNMRTIAQEVIANGSQYPEYTFDTTIAINTSLPQFKNHRLTSFFDQGTGLYAFIGKVEGQMKVIGIYSKTEIQNAIDLEVIRSKK